MSTSLHIEIVQVRQSRASKDYIEDLVRGFLIKLPMLTPGATINNTAFEDQTDALELKEHVQCITFCDAEHEADVSPRDADLVFHVHMLDQYGVETDTMTDDTSGEEVSAADVWSLPAAEFHGLWESLIYDTRLKEDTLRYVKTALELTDRGVNPLVVGWSRVVLLHGPPGTGKTSLCRALAQKLSIRLGDRFSRARLLEINAHGLFSKWFSESGKLVAKLFERVREIASDPRMLCIVLVDEVESLAHARRAAMAGLEPSDALRAVNALLTQLDRLRRLPNALVLATSNLTTAVDVAFVDRADLKRRVGPPAARAAYEILRGCCEELMARGVVAPRDLLFGHRVLQGSGWADSEHARPSLMLWEVAQAASQASLSGRALRRLPFLALALHAPQSSRESLNLVAFLKAMTAALQRHLEDEAALTADEPLTKPTQPSTGTIVNGH
ncbi:pachytene checkpoint protein 2 homolog [Cydia splendana]|uniref:pachytene checkpoint protein 2 homolog n=1 Tax=Cydia splendana TaxID=1100963 RepID=UPI00300C1D44